MVKKYEKLIQDCIDHIKVVKLGQEVTSAEIKKERVDLKKERQKYDRFLVRDKERLGYAKDMCGTRQMVMQSYQNEIDRQVKDRDATLLKEKIIQESIDNYKNMERVETAPKDFKKKRTKSKDMKSKSKAKAAPFDNVKSRLFQSIESSRQKSNHKYVNQEKLKYIAMNKENMDSQSIQHTNSKYGARSPKVSDSQSMMTGQKMATNRGAYFNISDQKGGILSNSGMKQMVQSTQPRKTVIFKQPTMEVDPQQEGEVAPFSGMGAGIGGTMFREVTELSEK